MGLNPGGVRPSWELQAEDKGVRREAESERSRRQGSEPTNRDRIQGQSVWTRGQSSSTSFVPVDEILPCGVVVECPVDTLVRGHHQAGGSEDAHICLEAVVCPVREGSPMCGPVYVILCSGEATSPMTSDVSGMTGKFPRLMGFRRLYGKPSIMRPSGRLGLCENDLSAYGDC